MTQRIREQRIHYKLDQITPINQYEMNAYNVPFAGNTSKCREIFIKGERVLEFNVDGDMTFEQFISKPIFRDELVECLFSMSKQMVSLVQNGLNLDKLVLDLKYMYIKLSDFTLQCIYLPLEKEFAPQNVGGFINGLLANITFAHTAAIECANQIIDYFNDHREFDVFQYNNFIKDMRAGSQLLIIQDEVVEEEFNTVELTSSLVSQSYEYKSPVDSNYVYDKMSGSNSGCPVLIRSNTGEKVVINKKVFCIGKADQGVDYKIIGNKSISRRHAYITCINGAYYVRDNNSTNHVYVDGKQIYSNVEVELHDNNVIRISNEDFIFKYK